MMGVAQQKKKKNACGIKLAKRERKYHKDNTQQITANIPTKNTKDRCAEKRQPTNQSPPSALRFRRFAKDLSCVFTIEEL